MTRVSNFFYFFENPSVVLTFFFSCPKKIGVAFNVALTTNILNWFFSFFINLFFPASTFWYLIHFLLVFLTYFYMDPMVLPRYHISYHRFLILVIINPNHLNVPPSQKIIKKLSFNVSSFKYFKNISAIMDRISNSLTTNILF